MSDWTDDRSAVEFVAGNEDARDAIMSGEGYGRVLIRIAVRMGRNARMEDDAVGWYAEIIHDLWLKRADIRERDNPRAIKTYMRLAVRSRMTSFISRRRRREAVMAGDERCLEETADPAAAVPELEGITTLAVRKLSARQREAICRQALLGQTPREIAEDWGTTSAAVRNVLCRARGRVREHLEGEDPELVRRYGGRGCR